MSSSAAAILQPPLADQRGQPLARAPGCRPGRGSGWPPRTGCPASPAGGRPCTPAPVRRVAPVVDPRLAQRLGQLRRAAEVRVVAAALAGQHACSAWCQSSAQAGVEPVAAGRRGCARTAGSFRSLSAIRNSGRPHVRGRARPPRCRAARGCARPIRRRSRARRRAAARRSGSRAATSARCR